MAGGKGKSTGGKAGPKEVAGKSQKSHSAKAGLQVRRCLLFGFLWCEVSHFSLDNTAEGSASRWNG